MSKSEIIIPFNENGFRIVPVDSDLPGNEGMNLTISDQEIKNKFGDLRYGILGEASLLVGTARNSMRASIRLLLDRQSLGNLREHVEQVRELVAPQVPSTHRLRFLAVDDDFSNLLRQRYVSRVDVDVHPAEELQPSDITLRLRMLK